jgi:tetratricopeptide (TPR) repeat protein
MSGPRPSPPLRAILAGALLVALIVATYAGSLRGGFLWDDDLHITANPTIVGPLGLKEIWTSARANYFPLVLTHFWVQHALWGLEPLGYRVVTLLFHAGAAILLWRVLVQLRVPGAWLGAALWALHPVQVESVAWICELKNTQSAVFFLAAILCYVRWLETGGVAAGRSDWRRGALTGQDSALPGASRRSLFAGRVLPPGSPPYAGALLCAILALLSKPSTVMLPVALVLVVWWLRGKVTWRDWLPLAPFFALSAAAAGWTIWEQKHHAGAIGPAWSQSLPERFALAGRVIWFYLEKLAWPEPLIFIYPRWKISPASLLELAPLAAAGGGLIALWLGGVRRSVLRAAFLAAAYFVALLFPVLGFFNVYFFRYSFVGDHFQYLASMGPLALAGAALALGSHVVGRLPAGVLVTGFALLSWRESAEYRDNETLWRATLARNPQATMAWLNLGDTLLKAERLDEAIGIFTHVTRVKPDDMDAFNDLGGALLLTDRPAEALAALERAAVLAPRRAEVHNNLGNAMRALGRTAEASVSFRRALELDPDYAEAHNNLGAELAEDGRVEEAIEHFQQALRRAPKNASALSNLGSALRALGRLEEAASRHREALRLAPDYAEALAGLGHTLVLQGAAEEGLAHLRRAVERRPGHVGIRGQFGRALAATGRAEEAQAQFRRAAELAPHSADARNSLGAALAVLGRAAEAIAEFERAVELAPGFAGARINLGNAYFGAARWAAAEAQYAAAVQLRPADADVHARLAVARVNAGRLEAAVPDFETALRLDPRAAEVHDNFAQVLRALGRHREALEHFERAAELRRRR